MTDPREELIRELDRARHGAAEVGSDAVLLRSPTCGDEIRLEIDVEGALITGMRWRGRGCTVSMASASALAALAPGLPVDRFGALLDDFRAVVRGPVLDPLATDPDSDSDPDPDWRGLGDAMAFAGIGRLPLRVGCADLAWAAVAKALASR